MDCDLEGLSTEFGKSLEAPAERLEFSEGEIEGFDHDNKELKIKFDRMLCTWKRREASSATYEVLYKALCQKTAEITPIPKHGNHELPNNNRPISLLPALSKVCEGVAYNQFVTY